MAKEKSPAFQFYPKDWLSDPNVQLMTAQARGVYIHLLAFCWLDGSIPGDPKKLCLLAGDPSWGPLEWDPVWELITPCFKAGPGGRLTHPRLEKERLKQNSHHQNKSKAGKKGAAKRWKDKGENSTAMVLPLAKNSFSSSVCSLQSSKDLKHLPTKAGEKDIKRAFLEDWDTLPRKAGKKEKAYKKYKATVGADLANNRPKFQERVKVFNAAMAGREKAHVPYGDTFINNWQTMEFDEAPAKGNGQPHKPNTYQPPSREDCIPVADLKKLVKDFKNIPKGT